MEKEKPEEKVQEKPTEELENLDKTEEVKIEIEKNIITDIPKEDEIEKTETKIEFGNWKAKTSIGKKVIAREITDINEILESGTKILEAEIVEILVPEIEKELLLIGQAKGKFGGGQRRVFRQTQKKTPEGNNPSFACIAVVGNFNGYIGVGNGKSRDTVPAREKAFRKAKLNLFKIRRGCGSWECGCKTPHSIPFEVEGKCGSVHIKLMPAPKGKGLIIEPECAKILKMAGIKDVWSKTYGQTKVKINLIDACVKALKQLSQIKITKQVADRVGLADGKINATPEEE